MALLKISSPGSKGVDVDTDPLTMEDQELRLAQNAVRDVSFTAGLGKRPGLAVWTTTPASGAILGGIGVPLQNLSSTGLHIFFLGRGLT